MSKKVLSIVLALALALSCFAVSAFAMGQLGYEEEDSTFAQAWSLSEAVEGADGWYVEVSLTADYAVGAMQFALEFSDANTTIADVIPGDALLGEYNADIAFDTTGASNIVAIIPNPEEDAAAAVDASEGIVVCTVYFADGAAGTVQIADDAKSATNPGGTLFAARMADGILADDAIIGQAATIETPARNIGEVAAPQYTVSFDANGGSGAIADVVMEAGDYVLPECTFAAPAGTEFKAWSVNGTEYAPGETIAVSDDTVVKAVWVNLPAELVLTATGSSKGVIIDNAHTFGGAYAGVVYGISATTYKTKANITNHVEASNGGSIVVKASDGKTTASGNYGTGSTIEVLNADGTSTGKVYVFVVFGDVDGNGLINTVDGSLVISAMADASVAPNNSVKRMAGNCQMVTAAAMMHTLNTNDAKAIINHVGGTKIDQVAFATKMASLTGTYYK